MLHWLVLAGLTSYVLQLVFRLVFVQQGPGRPLPGPPQHPFLGHTPLVSKTIAQGLHLDVLLHELVAVYGRIFSLNFLLFRFCIVTEPELTKEVVHARNYPKAPTYAHLFPVIGHQSILVADEETWAQQRKAFTHGFSYGFLKDLVPVFTSKGKRIVARMEQLAASKEVAILHDLTTRLTLDIICQIALQTDFDFLSCGKDPRLYTLFKELMNIVRWYNDRPHLAWTRYLPWNYMHLHKVESEYDSILMDIIKHRIAEVKSSGSASQLSSSSKDPKQQNILTVAIETAQTAGDKLELSDIISQVKTFLFAGHDTTASTMAWVVYALTQNPKVEQKLLAEIEEVCGARDPTADDLNQMKYLTCVVKEALRLWPPAGTARAAPPGTTLGGFNVSRTILYLPHYCLHRDAGIWGPDAEEFRPERWLDEAYVNQLHPYAFQPFSKGPRDCLGQNFAMLEAKALVTMLVSRFRFEYAGPAPETTYYQITTLPKYGVPVRVFSRKKDD